MTNPLMTYISSAQPQASGARKYTGSVATGYDAKRVESPKWAAEQEIIESIIDLFDEKSWVLDVPVGTGRFIHAYERNELNWIGIDRSEDMIAQAKSKRTSLALGFLGTGDVTELDVSHVVGQEGVDLSIMCRLTRWVGLTGNEKSVEEARAILTKNRTQALHQLQRVTKNVIVFTARVANHPYAYPMEDIKKALCDGWKIARNIECGEPDYRVIVLERE